MQIQVGQKSTNPSSGKIPSAEKLSKIFEVSARQIDRLTGLVDDLLDVSRIEAGKLTYTFEEVNLSELVREVSEQYEDMIVGENGTLTLELEENVTGFLDRFRIEQVITNLFSNSIKYGAGKPINVQLHKSADRFATLKVQDFGLGIKRENQSKIFERFERAISATNISGLGLGLYISRNIVKGHRGSILVQSELGSGSTFTVRLPLDRQAGVI